MPKHGHVVLGDFAPVLLYQIGSHETRALVDIPDNTPAASVANGGVKAYLRNIVLPGLPESVRQSFEAALDSGRLRSMPNSFLSPSVNRVAGLMLLGDAMNMRHPLTGGGMTVGLNDVALLADLLSPETVADLQDTRLVLRQLRTFHWRRKNLSSVINILAQALYSLFSATGQYKQPPLFKHPQRGLGCRLLFEMLLIFSISVDPRLAVLRLGCFRYFQLGGNCVDGPVGLLSGLVRRPLLLFYHFFAVALYSIWIRFTQLGYFSLPLIVFESVAILWRACLVIFPYIYSELSF